MLTIIALAVVHPAAAIPAAAFVALGTLAAVGLAVLWPWKRRP